jgi:Zn ribbon nucleic-acid-binding protein
MSAQSLVDEILRCGGTLKLEGDTVKYRLPEDVAHLVGELRAHKPELIEFLRQAGGRIAAFPHCPKCASYALYRADNLGKYECQSCGLQNIEEIAARRVQ